MRHVRVDGAPEYAQHPVMEKTRVLLADGHRSFVEALAMRLDAEPNLQVVATTMQPEDAIRIVSAQPIDVAVLAADSESGFIPIGKRLQEIRPGLQLVAMASGDDTAVLASAVRQGFRGWIPKELGIAALLDTVQAVSRGETSIPPAQLSRLLPYLLTEEEQQRAAEKPLATLTARELQILKAMVAGYGRQEIAAQLSISSNTVRTHMQSILNKLGVHSSLAAVTVARKAGIS
jgi:DNA-binding NarL/FixJ family response regulator